ncbi:MAG: recombinase RecT [Hyphomicrobiales bacterium]
MTAPHSTTDLARRDDAQAPARQASPQSVLQVFDNASFKSQVAAALPRHIGVDSMMRIALTEVRLNADLQKCTVPSFMGALLKAAQSGLRPGMFGEGWIIPRWNGKLGSLEAQFQPGYMGLAQLAYRSGEVADILAEAVYPSDHFKYQLGSDPKIEHVPDMEADHFDAEVIAFYAVVKLTNGGTLMKVLRRAEVDDVRDRFAPKTKAGKIVGPWNSDYEAMGRKTVLIQALKLAPKESERLAVAMQAETDALFGDRVAAGVVDLGKPVAERVAERIGARIDEGSGEVLDGEADEEPASGETGPDYDDDVPFGAPDSLAPDEGDEEPPGRGPRGDTVTPLRPPAATQAQLGRIAKLRKSSGIYDAEYAAILDSYGATQAGELTRESAEFVLAALTERGAR